jgi:3-oxoacyl-[acyl-carrier-protein] synthase-3
MRYNPVYVEAIGYELPPNVVTSSSLEARLAPLYEKLRLPQGQLAYLTGINERRWWDPGFVLSDGAVAAAEKALDEAGVPVDHLGAVVYTGVCRENHEPATACAVAHKLGVRERPLVVDLANACLAVLNGMLAVANIIELGQIKAGLVVSCETAREINDIMISEMLRELDMEHFTLSLATLTGGSGAVAVVLSDGSYGATPHRLIGGASRTAPEFHELCRWGADRKAVPTAHEVMETDAVQVLKNGVALGTRTWHAFLAELGWGVGDLDRVICHQVGSANRVAILNAFGMGDDKDFSTFPYLGNIGTVSVPITAAIAAERDVLAPGDKVGLLGIGSGLNCLMLGLEW